MDVSSRPAGGAGVAAGPASMGHYMIPSATTHCLVAGSMSTGLPASVCAGLSTGRVQVYGDEGPPLTQHDLGSSAGALTRLACVQPRGATPLVAGCDNTGRVALFELSSSRVLRLLSLDKVHGAAATTVALSPSRAWLASAAEDGSVAVSDMSAMAMQGCAPGPNGGGGSRATAAINPDKACVNDVVFCSEQTLAVAGSSPGQVLRTWDLRESSSHGRASAGGCAGLPSRGSAGPLTALTALAVHGAQPYQVASGDAGGGVQLWDMRQRRVVLQASLHGDTVSALKFHPVKSHVLLTASHDGEVLAVDLSAAPPGTPGAAEARTLVHSFAGMACTSLDVCVDEITGPLVSAGCLTETVVVKPLYER